jgi:hypothetical protein
MAPFMSLDDVASFAGVSRKKVFQVLALHRATGDVIKERDRRRLGRPRVLTLDNVGVSRLFLITCEHSILVVSSRTNR